MAEINRKNEDTHKANVARHEKAEEEFNKFKREIGEQVTCLQESVAMLGDKFAALGNQVDNRLAQQQASSSARRRTRPAFAAASLGHAKVPSLATSAYSNMSLHPSDRPALSTVLFWV